MWEHDLHTLMLPVTSTRFILITWSTSDLSCQMQHVNRWWVVLLGCKISIPTSPILYVGFDLVGNTARWSSPSDVLGRIWVVYSLWALLTSRFSAEDLYRAFNIIDLQNVAQGGFTPIHSDVVPFRRLSMLRVIYNSIHEFSFSHHVN